MAEKDSENPAPKTMARLPALISERLTALNVTDAGSTQAPCVPCINPNGTYCGECDRCKRGLFNTSSGRRGNVVASTAADSAKSSLQPGLFARRLRPRKDLDDQDIEQIRRIIERDGFQVN